LKNDLKDFYATYHDQIFDKRFNSPYPIRRKVHRDIYDSILKHIKPGMKVLDAGCGEGVLSILMAKKGAIVTGVDFSLPNIESAIEKAKKLDIEKGLLTFQVGDAENLPFDTNSFDCVVSNHVLEHLPDFDKGLQEIYRVTKKHAIIAVPTCLNPCSWALLGGDTYWKVSKRTIYAVPFGILRVLWALITRQIGVNEGYAGKKNLIHIFRFPWVSKQSIRKVGFNVVDYEAQSLAFPYINANLNNLRNSYFFRNLGIGTVYVLNK